MKIVPQILLVIIFTGISECLFSQIPNVRVTNDSYYQNEPMVAINPTNTNKMVCGFNAGFYAGNNLLGFKLGFSWSDDGGYSWTYGGQFSVAGYNRGGDPVVAFDNTGTAYIAGLVYNYDATTGSGGKDGSIFLAKSGDGGHTFNIFQKLIVTGSGRNQDFDKPWLFINPFNNYIYLAWDRRDNAWGIDGTESMTIWFTRSTDGGQNFSTPIQVSSFSPATGTNRSHGPQITATSANQVYVSWHTLEAGTLPNPPTTPWKIWISESTDGGNTFGTNYLVQNSVWGYQNRFISMDSDPSNGRIYIGYSDSHVQSPRDYDIFVTSAASAAGPWSSPVKINDDPAGTGRWQFWTSLDIAPQGCIDVMWYDQRDDPNKVGVYFSSSSDRGSTWSKNRKVTDLATGFTSSSDFAGDYNGLASINGKTQVVWMDNRNIRTNSNGQQYNDQEIYTASVIVPTERICFPPHRGVPGSPNPPVIDGIVQEDISWSGANRITYGNGTNISHMACQTLKHNSDSYIYLSFEVRNDPTFDNNDVIVICFRPDIANGSSSNDRKIIIYPICDNIGAGGQNCNATTQDNQPPRQIKFYRNSAGWIEITQQITNVDVKVSSRSNGSSNEWNVELKLPTSISAGGSQWVNFTDQLLFYYNVFRVSSIDGTVSEFRWPTNSPEANGDINIYPFFPSEWGEADKSNTAVCKGVSLSNYSDIGTMNTPSSQILFTAPPTPNTHKNTFYANVQNNTEVGGVPQEAKDVFVRFRIANWGIPGQNDWTEIPAVNQMCPNDVSNPTCIKNIPAGTSGSSGMNTFNFEWTVPDAEIPNYQANWHQCILVELDSKSNTIISTKSIYRNMDFVSASSFSRSAEISARGYGTPPVGLTSQRFALQVTTQEYVYGGGTSFDTLALQKLLKIKLTDETKPVSVLNYVTHGYRYLGRLVIINELKYDIVEPVGSFGYIVSHKGLVKEWNHKITGCEMIQPNLYKLDIPPEEKAIIVTEIEPVDYVKNWSFSLHAGLASPTGTFANSYDLGYNVLLDADYHFTNNWSIVALFGYNNFKSKIAGIDDTYIINVSANIRYEQLIGGPWSIYLGGGPGLYIPESGDNKLGANGGFGFNYDYNGSIIFELGGDYNTVFGNDTKFIHNHIGIIYRF